MEKKSLSSSELQKIENEILYFIKDVCDKNGIMYYLAGGTALGAVRHKGFIPWDDDVDIYMYRADYNKFRDAMDEITDSPYKLKYIDTDRNYTLPLPKVIDSRTILTQLHQREQEPLGVYVDLFILDNVPDNRLERKLYLQKVNTLQRLWNAAQNREDENEKKLKYVVKRILRRILWKLGPRFFAEKLDKLAQKYNNNETRLCGNMTYSIDLWKAVAPKALYGKGRLLEFEGVSYIGPGKIEKYLEHFYGDYMQFPPVEEQISLHNFNAYYR